MEAMNLYKVTLLQNLFLIGIITISISCGEYQNHQDNQDKAAQKNDSASKINELENDAHFLVSASEIHMEEISLGQLAQTNASLTDVKELGKMMEAEHTKLLNDLKQLAQHKLFVLPSSPADHSQDAYNNLNEKSPADFDKEYCKMLVSGHEDAIEQFEKASKESTDQEIREWATASLPVLKKHLQHAISCLKKNEKL